MFSEYLRQLQIRNISRNGLLTCLQDLRKF